MLPFALLLLAAGVAGRPSKNENMHEAMTSLAVQIDNAQLTSSPLLKMGPTKLKDMEIAAGEEVVLRCEFTSTPVAFVHWTKNGKVVQGDKNLNIMEKLLNAGSPIVESGIVSSIYLIPCASQEDSGNYKCVAFNGHKEIESAAEITVVGESTCKSSHHHSPPTIVQFSDSRFEMDGNVATLICRTNKPATISWDYDGEPLKMDESKYELSPSGDLMVKDIHWEDMGTYGCRASNKYGEDRVETFLYPTKKKLQAK